jgi:dihydrofolate synthase/folylpolyglutamate synthase
VLGANPPAVDRVVERVAVETGARLVKASDGVTTDVHMVDGRAHLNLRTPTRSYGTIRLSLAGRHQVNNAVTAVRLLEALPSELGFEISESAIVVAVQEVVWPARLETITVAAVEVLLDGAHNPAGAGALAAHVLETYHQPLPMIVGAMRDKALDALVAALAPAASHFVFTAASTPRAAAPIDLLNVARQVAPGVPGVIEVQPIRAVSMAAAFGSPVVVAGSLYLAGEIRAARS